MINWYDQSRDVANLFNPAFLAELVRNTAQAYRSEKKQDMPVHLAFISTPLILYTDSRSAIKGRSFSYLHTWVAAHPHLRIRLARRINEIAPYVRLSIAFALKHSSFHLTDAGRLEIKRRRAKDAPNFSQVNYFTAARTLGKWFARVDQEFNIYLMLGIKP